jgi:folate-binding protein YgfZ
MGEILPELTLACTRTEIMTTEAPRGGITQLGCLIARGADAAEFLQGQLSADLVNLESGQLTLAGWHNPQGRIRCLLWAGPLETNWRLVTETSQLDALATGLSRYVLRSEVSFVPDPDAQVVVVGDVSKPKSPQTSQWPLPGKVSQALIAGPQEDTSGPQAGLAAMVAAGVPWLEASLTDVFLGQSLNLDILTGISFTKGCYPGQEVLARLNNLGRVKRRLFRFGFEGSEPQPGASITNAEGEPRGQVVCSSGKELLAGVELRGLGNALLIAGTDTPLTALPLPYEIPEQANS